MRFGTVYRGEEVLLGQLLSYLLSLEMDQAVQSGTVPDHFLMCSVLARMAEEYETV